MLPRPIPQILKIFRRAHLSNGRPFPFREFVEHPTDIVASWAIVETWAEDSAPTCGRRPGCDHFWAWRRRWIRGFGKADFVQRCSSGGDFACDLLVASDQLGNAFLDVGGVQLCLGLSCHTGSCRRYRKILAHNVSGTANLLDRVQHTPLGEIDSLGSPARYRGGFVEDISQTSYLYQVGEGSLLSRLGSDTLPHCPAWRHRSPMNRGECGLPMLGSSRPVPRRVFQMRDIPGLDLREAWHSHTTDTSHDSHPDRATDSGN